MLKLCKATHHRGVKVKSGTIVVVLKIFIYKATSDCFINLSRIVFIFCILANNNIVHMSHHFGCHGNHFDGNLFVTIDTKLLYRSMAWCSSNTGCATLCDSSLENRVLSTQYYQCSTGPSGSNSPKLCLYPATSALLLVHPSLVTSTIPVHLLNYTFLPLVIAAASIQQPCHCFSGLAPTLHFPHL